jgi:hypothetical protein
MAFTKVCVFPVAASVSEWNRESPREPPLAHARSYGFARRILLAPLTAGGTQHEA